MKKTSLVWAAAAALACGAFAEDACPVGENTRGHENIEWSIGYGFHLTDGNRQLPRVLLVGDSICNGYQGGVQRRLEGKVNVSYWVSSYCLTMPSYRRLLELYLDESAYDVVHFNNGLHSLGTDVEAWARHLRESLALIRRKQPKANIVLCTSTPLKDPKLTAKAKALNDAARKVIAEPGMGPIAIDDLFSLLDPLDRNANWSDTFHHTGAVREKEADQVAACVLKALPATARPAARLTEPKVFEQGGRRLLYRWHAPKTLAPGRKYPLVVLFHGAGERGADNLAQLVHGADELLTYAQRTGEEIFFIAGQVPNGEQWVNTPWSDKTHTMSAAPSASMALALGLVDRTLKELPVDASRVYATGISMGGYGTWDAVQRRPELFAAAMPICGGGDVACAAKIAGVPIWCFHGDQDTAVPTSRSRDMFAAVKAAGGNIQYREYPGVGHNCWTRTYGDDEVLKWLFSQRKR